MADAQRTVVVFGGTGFLGRRVVLHLRDRGFAVRVVARHPERAKALFEKTLFEKSLSEGGARLTAVKADIQDEESVAAALAGAWGAANAVSLYAEKGGRTFHGVHVEAAGRLAAAARRAEVQRLIQLSGIGADPRARSAYVRSRGEGEAAVRAAFPEAIVIRPSAMFAAEDGFTASLAGMMHKTSVFPLFGAGSDAAAAGLCRRRGGGHRAHSGCARAGAALRVRRTGGADLQGAAADDRPPMRPPPLAASGSVCGWRLLAAISEWLPNPPVTEGMVALMRHDNVVSGALPGLAALGIAPKSLETVLG